MVSIKMKNGIMINVSDSQADCISRQHNGKLELDFNPHIIHVMNGDRKEVAYSFSEIKIVYYCSRMSYGSQSLSDAI